MSRFVIAILLILFFIAKANAQESEDNSPTSSNQTLFETVEHHYADNDGVRIHYVTKGEGQVVLFVHGFPDFWYTWRNQMNSLSNEYRVAAMDLRGYNRSDSPTGVDRYDYKELILDIVAVIQDTGVTSVCLVAHDWGAGIAWQVAAKYPDLVEKLVILSISHPKAGNKKPPVSTGEKQPSYADYFVSEKFRNQLTENWFSGWVKDQSAKERYKEAFRRSDPEAMINYYRANFPTLENLNDPVYVNRSRELPNLKMPVLIIHGKNDPYALTPSHNNTWDYVDNDLRIEILNNSGHFIQQDESEKVTALIENFLSR
ncbi:MAG: alpha/beta hydrolase [Reichenbachiella sp.]|uniref:alpha/beta fold hydrolase n=1 Tax=Reichenbachiella sp. TaxID=2184521 RepID=UPI003266D5BE